ncbi:LuxR family transcriptional regulator [Nocardia colli]|uniref:LuxR family transcriptional regulator n=1 Tax=Nocardia colli TaxID=2545717 RepID=A0A5N0EKU1_9NOCA|nr:LuxR C-terminal-related transcriptional regulator [Nocardia colli]KAA8888894.1 LuxR family transcriptional regulator [Nocardia colli]
MQGKSLDVLTAGVEHACRTVSGAVAVQCAVAAVLRQAVAFDAWCALTIDPASVLPTGGFHRDGLPLEYMPQLLEIEARGDDALALPTLARGARRAVTLWEATGGHPETSRHYQQVLEPSGMTREMRVLFGGNANVWGALILFRAADAPGFADADTRLAARATGAVADAIRRELTLTEIAVGEDINGPGLILLTPELDPITTSPTAARWLDQVDDDVDPQRELPYCVLNLAHQARSRPGRARSRVRTRAGRWLTLHAERLPGPDEQLSIIIEATRPVEIAALVADVYRLTQREREVVGLLARGFSRTEIARLLALSAYTVDDHIKRVFGKLEVRSRAELTAKLFFDQHVPRIEKETPIGGTGWYLR